MHRVSSRPAVRTATRPAAPPRRVLPAVLLAGLGVAPALFPALAQESPPGPENPPASQEPAARDPWEPLRLLAGSWEADIEGRLGHGAGLRRYEFVYDGLYLVQRHASVRLPQEKSPAGDYHRELAVYSYDRERETIVLREFMIEGYVVRSTCETEPKRIVCTAESVESGSGIRARLTIDVADRYRFDETYELAFPGQELKVFFTNRWTRVPDFRD